MLAPDLSIRETPFGFCRNKHTVMIGASDFDHATGFTCQVAAAGDLTYRALEGEQDVTETGLSAADVITGPGDIPVVLKSIRGTSTVTSVVIGII